MATSAKFIKHSGRTRQAARKAGIKIEEQNDTKSQQPQNEQEEPDIM